MIQNIILQSKHKIVQDEYKYFKLSQSQQELQTSHQSLVCFVSLLLFKPSNIWIF